jgi:hypothetical protein
VTLVGDSPAFHCRILIVHEVKKVFQNEHIRENFEAAKGKMWEKIDELAVEVKSKGRKEAVAKFILMSGHVSPTTYTRLAFIKLADASCATIWTMSWTVNTSYTAQP